MWYTGGSTGWSAHTTGSYYGFRPSLLGNYRHYSDVDTLTTRFRYVAFKVTTDAAGCSSLTFTFGGSTVNISGVGFAKTTTDVTSASGIPSSWASTTKSGKTFTVSGVAMLPNTTYYVWLKSNDDTVGHAAEGSCTITGSGTYGSPGNITANNAYFGSAVSMSYGSSTSGGKYTVKVQVGSLSPMTLQNYNGTDGGTSSRNWTPSLQDYGNHFTSTKTVSCVITVETWFGGVKSGERTKTITLTFPDSCRPVTNEAFSIAPQNESPISGMTGYIQRYSKVRASFDRNGTGKVTLLYGATIAKWTVKFGTAADADVTGNTNIKDSDKIGETVTGMTVTCWVTDSRGFTSVAESLPLTTIPYRDVGLNVSGYYRGDSEGAQTDAGTYCYVSLTSTFASINGQNGITVTVQSKLRSSSTWGQAEEIENGTTTQDGEVKTYAVTNYRLNDNEHPYSDAVWDIRFTATDSVGNTAVYDIILESQAWALHIRNGGAGAAFGKAAERDSELDIGDWKITCGAISSVLIVEVASFSSLPKTLYHSGITADHVVLRDEVGTPSAMTSDWDVDTYDGSLTISGSISGSTTLRLVMGIPGTSVSG